MEEKDAEKGSQEREEIGQIVSIEELLRVFLKRFNSILAQFLH